VTGDFIGSGWAFPVRVDSTGGIALASGDQDVEESIRLIVATAPGERPMRPEFGCAIHDHVFAPASAHTVGRVADAVRRALVRWEPRIDVHDVHVTTDPADPARLEIDLLYSLRASNDPRNLVFPFYVLPSEGTPAAAAVPTPLGGKE